MALYKVVYHVNGKRFETEPLRVLSYVEFEARKIADTTRAKVVTIVRDSQGEDHPDNAGKFLLHKIVK